MQASRGQFSAPQLSVSIGSMSKRKVETPISIANQAKTVDQVSNSELDTYENIWSCIDNFSKKNGSRLRNIDVFRTLDKSRKGFLSNVVDLQLRLHQMSPSLSFSTTEVDGFLHSIDSISGYDDDKIRLNNIENNIFVVYEDFNRALKNYRRRKNKTRNISKKQISTKILTDEGFNVENLNQLNVESKLGLDEFEQKETYSKLMRRKLIAAEKELKNLSTMPIPTVTGIPNIFTLSNTTEFDKMNNSLSSSEDEDSAYLYSSYDGSTDISSHRNNKIAEKRIAIKKEQQKVNKALKAAQKEILLGKKELQEYNAQLAVSEFKIKTLQKMIQLIVPEIQNDKNSETEINSGILNEGSNCRDTQGPKVKLDISILSQLDIVDNFLPLWGNDFCDTDDMDIKKQTGSQSDIEE